MDKNMSEVESEKEFLEEIQKVSSLDELESLRLKYLGKKGQISLLLGESEVFPKKRDVNMAQR